MTPEYPKLYQDYVYKNTQVHFSKVFTVTKTKTVTAKSTQGQATHDCNHPRHLTTNLLHRQDVPNGQTIKPETAYLQVYIHRSVLAVSANQSKANSKRAKKIKTANSQPINTHDIIIYKERYYSRSASVGELGRTPSTSIDFAFLFPPEPTAISSSSSTIIFSAIFHTCNTVQLFLNRIKFKISLAGKTVSALQKDWYSFLLDSLHTDEFVVEFKSSLPTHSNILPRLLNSAFL